MKKITLANKDLEAFLRKEKCLRKFIERATKDEAETRKERLKRLQTEDDFTILNSFRWGLESIFWSDLNDKFNNQNK